MADKVIGVKLEADTGSATTNVKNFKQELKLAQQEVITLSEKFGATSKEAAAAAQKAAGLKDAIGDAASLVDAFNPDTKFRAFGAAINTVVGGFTALQGVMGLIGVESEDTQKALLKVQSALAISQGFSQLQEGVQTFKNLGAVIQATTIFQKANSAATAIATTVMRAFGASAATSATGFKVLKAAIAATGIGLLVVGLAAAADALGLFSDKSESAADAQAKLKQEIEGVNESLAAQGNFFSNEEKLEVARAKRRGASEEEIFNIQQKYRRLNYDATAAAYERVRGLDEVEAAKLLKQLDAQNINGQVAQLDFETKQNEKRLALAKDFQEKLNRQNEELKKKELEEAAKELARSGQRELNRIGGINVEIPKSQGQIEIENEVAAAKLALEEKSKLFLAESDLRSAALNDVRDKAINQQLLDEQVYQNRKSLLQSTGELFSALGALIGKETAAGKVLGIAQATINTFIGATEVLRAKSVLPEPLGTISKIINVAAIIATGLSAVKNIAKTQVPGASGGSVPSGLSVAAPLAPQKPQQTTTQLDQDSLNAIGNATVRAFVLEADVSSNQERVTRLNRAARLGG